MDLLTLTQEGLRWTGQGGGELEPKEIHIRKMNKKWASCSSKGRLTFDPSILDLSNRERAEIVLHELIHLRYPNHGKMFNLMLNTHLCKTQKGQV